MPPAHTDNLIGCSCSSPVSFSSCQTTCEFLFLLPFVLFHLSFHLFCCGLSEGSIVIHNFTTVVLFDSRYSMFITHRCLLLFQQAPACPLSKRLFISVSTTFKSDSFYYCILFDIAPTPLCGFALRNPVRDLLLGVCRGLSQTRRNPQNAAQSQCVGMGSARSTN